MAISGTCVIKKGPNSIIICVGGSILPKVGNTFLPWVLNKGWDRYLLLLNISQKNWTGFNQLILLREIVKIPNNVVSMHISRLESNPDNNIQYNCLHIFWAIAKLISPSIFYRMYHVGSSCFLPENIHEPNFPYKKSWSFTGITFGHHFEFDCPFPWQLWGHFPLTKFHPSLCSQQVIWSAFDYHKLV